VPDARAALAEWRRVTRAGGAIGGYVWDYAGQMQLLRYFWDAAVALDADARALDEGVRFRSAQPQALAGAFESAGLTHVTTRAIEVPTPFADFDDSPANLSPAVLRPLTPTKVPEVVTVHVTGTPVSGPGGPERGPAADRAPTPVGLTSWSVARRRDQQVSLRPCDRGLAAGLVLQSDRRNRDGRPGVRRP
jgi:hypothetical protein